MRPVVLENGSFTGQLVEVIFTSLLRTWETAELGGRGGRGEYGSATCSHFIKLGETDLLPFGHIFYFLEVGGVIALLCQLKTIRDV